MTRAASRRPAGARRLRQLVAAGLIDSFGLSLGWTLFNLHAVEAHGLAGVGLLNAAMLVGVALSAPATGWVARRLDGRWLLVSTAGIEAVLRVSTFVLLLADAPLLPIAAGVALMNVVSWIGYAGMRAEVAAVDSRAAAMTWYAVCILSVEAVGAAAAAVLPAGFDGRFTVAVVAVYAGCLLPQVLAGRAARVPVTTGHRAARPRLRDVRLLFAATGVMALASGPAYLAVALAADMHGRRAVAAAALGFTLGALLAPAVSGVIQRRGVRASVAWPLLGCGMVVGWVAAPWHLAGLLAAQLLSGTALSSFEGTMDARVATGNGAKAVTAGLAWTAATRALGGAVAVAATPTMVSRTSLSATAAAAAVILGVGGLVAGITGAVRRRPAPAPAGDPWPPAGALRPALVSGAGARAADRRAAR